MERFNSFSSDQIILTKRHVSMIMASMLLLCLFAFIVGFFLGKRSVIDDFSSQVTHTALHDQIDFLLTTQTLQNSQENTPTQEPDALELTSQIAEENVENTPHFPAIEIPENFAQEKLLQYPPVEPVKTTSIVETKAVDIPEDQAKKHYAQLIGFGTKKAALAFVARLKKHDVQVILKTVISKTATGKTKTWYQAITPTYNSYQELKIYIAKIQRLEHIRDKDIKIMYVK
jgi:hypothetical protein